MDETSASNSSAGTIVNTLRGLLGAVLGGTLAYFVTGWLARQGFYAMALPGVGIGLGAGLLATKRCMGVAIVSGLMALALGIFTEWKNFPFIKDASRGSDDSLAYFIRHLGDLRPLTMIMIGLGTFAGYWFALTTGRKRQA